MSGSIPIVLSTAGRQPQSVASLLSQLLTGAIALSPGLTANLPGLLIEDISSTEVAGLSLMDGFVTELINSITPYGANAFILNQLGQQAGIPQGTPVNGSVNVVFTDSAAGRVIPVGFTVSDGTNQYIVQDGGITGTDLSTQPLTAIASASGTFPIPANTVNQLVTGAPPGSSLTVNNPLAGTPATSTESEASYRSRVLQAGQVACQGTPQYLRTLLQAIPGVTAALVSIRVVGSNYEIICGGGDSYLIAGAIYQAVPNLGEIVGSTIGLAAVTQANPGQVTTLLNHGYLTGQVVTFSGVGGMTELNSGSYTITVIDEKNFTIGVNTSGYPAYTTGGQVLPNFRNTTVTIQDYPDTYSITFVSPPQQTVNLVVTWNTDETGFVAASSVAALAVPALVNYVNGLPVGQPMNLFVLQSTFQAAVASILPPQYLTRLVFSVSINGIGVSPESGTGILPGDPESYFAATAATVEVSQG